ncbi:hypothetical protein D3C75_1159120 [compost metagenome]
MADESQVRPILIKHADGLKHNLAAGYEVRFGNSVCPCGWGRFLLLEAGVGCGKQLILFVGSKGWVANRSAV